MTDGPAPGAPPVAVVTGGSSGIGKETARGLAARGFAVVLVGRDETRTRAAASDIARSTGRAPPDVVIGGDLAVIANVRTVADELLRRLPAIHVLVNNAGAYFARRDVTSDGLERTFALNVLAPFLLTYRLAPRLRASAPARIVDLSSMAHRRQHVDFSDLQWQRRRYAGFSVYGATKLEILLLSREFARRLAGTGVTVNAVHPGFVASGFGRNNGGVIGSTIHAMGVLFGRSVVRGADTPIFAASDPSLVRVTGEYLSDRRVHPGDAASRDAATAARLFEACAALAGVPPGGP